MATQIDPLQEELKDPEFRKWLPDFDTMTLYKKELLRIRERLDNLLNEATSFPGDTVPVLRREILREREICAKLADALEAPEVAKTIRARQL